ncbi:unnamed protein product [Prunus armeniaca]
MRGYGEELSRERIVQKMLISLLHVYDPICYVIEHSRDLDAIEVQEVVASLKSFAQRLERHHENKTEKAFASLSVDSKSAKVTGNQNSKHQKNWKDKGKKWDNKLVDGTKNSCKHCGKLHFGECRFKGKPKCYNCDKFGHIAKDCYSKKPVQQLQYAAQVTSTPTVFYVNNAADKRSMEDVWYLDSGCSNHMTGKEDVLTDIDRSIMAKVAMGTGQLVDVIGKGSLMVETKMGKIYIKEVLLVFGLKENLLSVGQMMEHGYFLIFGDNKAEIYDDCSLSNLVTREVFSKRSNQQGHNSTRIDDCTQMFWIYFLRYKYEVLTVFKKFKATVELQSGYQLKKLRSDRGGEYTSNEFNRFCDEMGMERQLTVAYSPQQNGVAERKNRTIVEMAKCMMFEKSMPLEFSAEAVNTAVYILNRCPTKALDKKTPFEAYSGRKQGLKHLRVFGYGSCEKGYRLYNITTGKVIISRDMVFNEDASWDWNAQQECNVSIPLTEMVSEKEKGINDTTVMQAENSVENDVLL